METDPGSNPDPHWDLDPDPQLEKMLDPDLYPDPLFPRIFLRVAEKLE